MASFEEELAELQADLQGLLIYTEDEILDEGLRALSWEPFQIQRVKIETNIERFRSHFGAHPCVLAQIWEDLQTTTIANANIVVANERDH